jgi:molybdopterin/thiamine biosynthesis adenylyltransferase
VGVAVAICAAKAHDLLRGQHLVLDGTDNLLSRHVVNDWCVRLLF